MVNNVKSTQNVAIISSTGALDNSFNIAGSGLEGNGAFAVEEDANGKILVGGYIFKYNGVFENKNIYRFNRDGSIDPGFNIGAGFNAEISDIKVDNNGRIWVVGRFTKFNSTPTSYMAILNSDGSLYKSFDFFKDDGSFSNGIRKIAFQKTGKAVVVGAFYYTNGDKTLSNIARVNIDGTLDATFKYNNGIDNISASISSVALNSADDIIVGGNFIGNGNIEMLKADGSTHPGFNQGKGANYYVTAIYIDPSDRFYIGGNFSTYQDKTANSFIRLKGGK